MRAGPFILVLSVVLLPAVARAVSCTVSASNQDFGSLPGTVAAPGGIQVTVVCPAGLTFYVNNDQGAHKTGNYTWRLAGPSGNYISYAMYQDAAHTVYDGGTPGRDGVTATGTGSSQIVYIYPKTFANTAIAGTYTDSMQIRVTVSGTQTTTQIAITATVNPTCTISANALNFGIYAGLKVDASTSLMATCTNATTYEIGADNGQNPQYIGVYAKYMVGPSSSRLRYHLYTDATRSVEWGTTSGTNVIPGTGTGAAQSIPVYGTVGAGSLQSVPGSYSDTVTVTITY